MQAIVLSRRAWRENDELITLYTYGLGKVQVKATGSKKITSKQSAYLEPGGVIECTLIPGRELSHIAKTQSVEYFSQTRLHLEKSRQLAFALSLVEKVTAERSPDANFFWFLRHWLEFLEKTEPDTPRLLDGLVLGLLVHLGFKPELAECVVCGRSQNEIYKQALLNPSERPGLYYAGGGLICPIDRKLKTQTTVAEAGERIVDLGLTELTGLIAFMSGDWRIVQNFKLNSEEEKALHTIIYEFLRYHVELPLRDWK